MQIAKFCENRRLDLPNIWDMYLSPLRRPFIWPFTAVGFIFIDVPPP
jgi:hypothetical protein